MIPSRQLCIKAIGKLFGFSSGEQRGWNKVPAGFKNSIDTNLWVFLSPAAVENDLSSMNWHENFMPILGVGSLSTRLSIKSHKTSNHCWARNNHKEFRNCISNEHRIRSRTSLSSSSINLSECLTKAECPTEPQKLRLWLSLKLRHILNLKNWELR